MTSVELTQPVVVVGLGNTGVAVAKFLSRHGIAFDCVDSRTNPPAFHEVRALPYLRRIHTGDWEMLSEIDEGTVILSPGLDPSLPIFARLREAGIEVFGEIELFARVNEKPAIGITGSNGKSTVTDLTAHLAHAAGLRAVAAGNIGTPAIELVDRDEIDLIVLELSSFQLETTQSLSLQSATVLNICDDHLDRHRTLTAYQNAKRRVFEHAQQAVLPVELENFVDGLPRILFGVGKKADYRLHEGQLWRHEAPLLSVDALKIKGQHNALNALAAIALLETAGIRFDDAMRAALVQYRGLRHRFEFVRTVRGIHYINDSKATNEGAALAALASARAQCDDVILIAGGDAKGASLQRLAEAINHACSGLVIIGRDGEKIARQVRREIPVLRATNMNEAVMSARALAREGSMVLLSPACSSLDMFASYEARGDAFCAAVAQLDGDGDET